MNILYNIIRRSLPIMVALASFQFSYAEEMDSKDPVVHSFQFSLDTLAPVVHSLSFSQDSIHAGESITVSLEMEDDLSGIEISSLWFYIDEPNGSTITLRQFQFYIMNDIQDIQAPIIHTITFSEDTVLPGETIIVTIDMEDDLSGVDLASMWFYINDPSNEIETISGWESVGNHVYEAKIEISEYAIDGYRRLEHMVVSDLANNQTTLASMDPFDVDSFYVYRASEEVEVDEEELVICDSIVINYKTVYDTVQVIDTNVVTVYDTVSIAVYDTLIFERASGIADELVLYAQVYPNLAHNLINVSMEEMGDYAIRLVNITGQEVFYTSDVMRLVQIDISTFEPGIYMLAIIDNDNQVKPMVSQIVIQ